jgi:hypothetical protein
VEINKASSYTFDYHESCGPVKQWFSCSTCQG